MDNRTELMKKVVDLARENGELLAKIDVLHRVVDDAETEKSANIIGGDIDPVLVRNVFGWPMSNRAKNALIEREAWFAAKKKEMRDAGIQL
jgi:hypothetical protein